MPGIIPKEKLTIRKGKKPDYIIDRDITILRKFTEVYCQAHHGAKIGLCDECTELVEYGRKRLEKCPYEPKPKCKKCPTHCYESDKRAKVKEIMKFSGIYFVKRGRIDWLIKYFMM